MIAEIKKGLKLIRYGYGLKINIAVAVFFMLIALMMMCVDGNGVFVGGIYILMTPLMLVQIQQTMLHSGMVASSARRKMMELYLPNFISIMGGVWGYLVIWVATICWIGAGSEEATTYIEEMIVGGVIISVCLIYFGAAFKFYWLSAMAFFVGLVIAIAISFVVTRLVSPHINMATASVLTFLVITAGALISCWLRKIFYKKQISPMAGGLNLRKAMQ